MDADVIRIPPANTMSVLSRDDDGTVGWPVREVRDGEKWILVEHVALEEPLQQIPRHWSLRRGDGGARMAAGTAAVGSDVAEARRLIGVRH